MTDVRTVPTEIAAEDAVLGAILLDSSQSLLGDLRLVLNPVDFFRPRAQEAYRKALDLHADGHAVDIVSLTSGMADEDKSWLLGTMTDTPSIGRAPYYADLVIAASRKRGWLGKLAEATGQIYDGLDVDEIIGELHAIDDPVLSPRNMELRDLALDIHEWNTVERAMVDNRPWLVSHILRPLWRIILVSGEGVGKAVLMRQIGLHAAAGLDPWDPSRTAPPIKVLYVDCENPAEAIVEQHALANSRVELTRWAGEMYAMWRREGGINLRKRVDRAEFEAVLRKVRPQLVLAGPLYKMFRRASNEDMEQSTIEFLEIIDDFRTRFEFAIILEHHAPKGVGAARDLTAFGSSALLRWPEFGIALNDQGKAKNAGNEPISVDIERFRADRVKADWPVAITRNDLGAVTAWTPRFGAARGSAVGARWVDDEWTYPNRG